MLKKNQFENLIWILLEFVAATQKSAFLCVPPSDSVVRTSIPPEKNRVGIDAAVGNRGYSHTTNILRFTRKLLLCNYAKCIYVKHV